MNQDKYKSVVVDRETYDIISNLSEKNDKSIASTAKKFIHIGLSHEAEEANIDCRLKEGGTPRLNRLLEDLRWFRVHAGVFIASKYFLARELNRYVIDTDESRALDITIETVFDCTG